MALALKYDFITNPSLTGHTGPDQTFTRASSAVVTDWEGVLRTVQSGEARFTGARRVENLQGYSQDLDISTAGWLNSDCNITKDAAVAPDGTTTAELLTATAQAGNQTPFAQDALNLPRVGTYIVSFYAKAGTVPYAGLYTPSFDVGPESIFDLSGAGSVLTTGTGADSAGIELATVTYPAAPAGWYRCWHIMTLTSDISGTIRVGISEVTTTIRVVDPDGTETGYLWGIQVEDVSGQADQTTPSEYVATLASAPSAQSYTTEKDGTTALTGITGYRCEDAATNLCLYSEDQSNAAWVAANVTKGATSVITPNGAASTTVRLTASAANGTILQTITSAVASRAYSVYMKRVTGTGNIDLTVDNGVTWTTKTLTTSWQRFDITQLAVTNPVIGVRIVTNTDAIDFWGSDLESTAYATTYIPTTTVSVTRVLDNMTATLTTEANIGEGTTVFRGTNTNNFAVGGYLYRLDDGTNSNRIYSFPNTTTKNVRFSASVAGGSSLAINSTAYGVTNGVEFISVLGYATNDCAHYIDGIANGTDATFGPSSVAFTRLTLGLNSTISDFNGDVGEYRYYDTRHTDAELEDMSNGIFPTFGSSYGRFPLGQFRQQSVS